MTEWILDWPIFKEKIPRWEWPILLDKFQLIDVPFERYVAGGILKQLLQDIGPWNAKSSFPQKPASDDLLNRAITVGIDAGLAELGKQLHGEAKLAGKFVDNGFQVRAVMK